MLYQSCLYFSVWSFVYISKSKFAFIWYLGRVKRIWYLSPMRAARIRAVSPEPSLLAHTSSESRGTFRQKARSLAPLNGWACAVKICHDGMLEDANSLDAAHLIDGLLWVIYEINDFVIKFCLFNLLWWVFVDTFLVWNTIISDTFIQLYSFIPKCT